jgi:hypothetical protein
MKKLFKTLAIALVATGLTFNANAADDKTSKSTFEVGMYRVTNTMKINVLITKTTGAAVSISLKDENGTEVYSEKLGKKDTSYSRKLNLENLSDGKYTLVVSNGTEKTVKEIDLSTKALNPADYRNINF